MIVSKLPGIGTSIFAEMSAVANEHKAINLSQGFPDFDVDPCLIGYVDKYMKQGFNQYAQTSGLPVLRANIALKYANSYGLKLNADDNITVTSGATEALFTAISTVVRPGDEVIVFDPAYDSYVPAIELNGGTAVCIALKFPRFTVDWDIVADAINSKTKAIIVNNPHNPTGSVFTPADLVALKEVVKGKNIVVISDEVYEHIVFDGQKHQSVLLDSDLFEQCMAVYSFGKTFHATGWKVGYCVAPKLLTKEFRKVHQFVTFSTCTPIQHALSDYIEQYADFNSISEFYQEKRDRFLRFTQVSRFEPIHCNGTYFQLMSFRDISKKNDKDFALELAIKYKVAAIPLSAFYQDKSDHKLLRFCFAKKTETMEKAGERICLV